MIRVENLTRRYGELLAVDDVSFTIQQGEVVGLLGHNGAGKTTIMKMITGFLEPTSGRIIIDDLDIDKHRQSIQKRIGYLPENCPVWPEMRVIDYLSWQAGLHGVAPAEVPAAVARVIRRTALREKATAQIQTLSRGYRQRVGVAQAILHDPDIIILDEPTNGLDPTQILHMRDLIRELATTATVIVSTHILQEVQAVCQRVLILRSGKLAVDQKLDQLQQSSGIQISAEGDVASALSAFPDLKIASQKSAGDHSRYLLEATPEQAPDIAGALVKAGVRLHRLAPQQHDLETLFAEVNGELNHG